MSTADNDTPPSPLPPARPPDFVLMAVQKSTGKILEMQSHARAGTLIGNAAAAGYDAGDVEEREVTDAEYAELAAAAAASLPRRYLLAEDFVRLQASLPAAGRAALRQARASNDDIDGLYSLMLAKGPVRIDMLGVTFRAHAWPAIEKILTPAIGAAGVVQFRAALEAAAAVQP